MKKKDIALLLLAGLVLGIFISAVISILGSS